VSGKFISTLVRTKAVSSQLETTPAEELPSASEQQTPVIQRCRMQSVLMSMTFACIFERDTGRSNLRTGKVFRYRASGPRIFDQSRSESRYATPAWPVWRSAGISPTSTFTPRNGGPASDNWIKLGRSSQYASVPGCWFFQADGSRSCSSPSPFPYIGPARDS
jgi:hypothetical protein